MKYSIAVKFVAIILCAASLVGVLACAGGILALTETGMYSMSAEQAKEKQIRLAGDSFAKDEAVYYCSEVLGGMPKQLLDQKYPVMNSTFNFNHAGYALKDAEGNLLAGNGALNAGTAANTYSFHVSGKYLHLVSATPTSQLEIQRAAQSNPEALVYSGEDGYYFYSMIPVEGARVSSIRMDYLTEDYEAEFDSYHAGFVFYSTEGDLIFRIMDGGIPEGLIRMAELKDENGNGMIGVTGHSMGTWAAWSVAAAYSGTEIEPRATALQCGELFKCIRDEQGRLAYDNNNDGAADIHFNNVLMVTAKDAFDDMRTGFQSGTDDYMVKPVNVNEMVLRVGALLRRAQMMNERRQQIGQTLMECDSLTVIQGDQSQVLPQKEFMLLYKMAAFPGRIFTRQQLMDEIWGYDAQGDAHTVEVHIARLRERFRNNPDFKIVTIRGVGYKVMKT